MLYVSIMTEYDIIYLETLGGPLQRLSVEFARQVAKWATQRSGKQSFSDISLKQIYRAGTSVGANIREAQYAESKRDFVHKLKIAEKELGEFYFWFGLLLSTSHVPEDVSTETLKELAADVRKLLIAIIVKTKKSLIVSPK